MAKHMKIINVAFFPNNFQSDSTTSKLKNSQTHSQLQLNQFCLSIMAQLKSPNTTEKLQKIIQILSEDKLNSLERIIQCFLKSINKTQKMKQEKIKNLIEENQYLKEQNQKLQRKLMQLMACFDHVKKKYIKKQQQVKNKQQFIFCLKKQVENAKLKIHKSNVNQLNQNFPLFFENLQVISNSYPKSQQVQKNQQIYNSQFFSKTCYQYNFDHEEILKTKKITNNSQNQLRITKTTQGKRNIRKSDQKLSHRKQRENNFKVSKNLNCKKLLIFEQKDLQPQQKRKIL